MFSAILALLTMPYTDLSKLRGIQFRPLSKIAFYIFVANFLILMQLGAKHVESPFIEFGQISTVLYFSHFLLIVPFITLLENSLTDLATIQQFIKKTMTSLTFFFIFIPLLSIILLTINILLSPHNPYQEKNSAFECGFHSFLGQNRTQFSISFFIFALLFLLFDLEILLVYPYVVSAYTNGIYGLIIMLIFFFVLTLGFVFELGKNALKIDSRQMNSFQLKN
jgi:NADH-ubiquinone oxidoreductase chain 3